MNYPLLALAMYAGAVTGLAIHAARLLTLALADNARYIVDKVYDGQLENARALNAACSLQSQANTKLSEEIAASDAARTDADLRIVKALDAVLQATVTASNAEVEAYATLAEAVQKSLGTHQDLHALVETNMRDLRGRAGTGGAKDRCAQCGIETASWFINGRGQVICPTCHPAGYADAKRRGSAHQG